MKLPDRVSRRMGWSKFLFYISLDTILSLMISFAPPSLLFYFLKPENFVERLLAVVICLAAWGALSIAAFFFWVFFITWTTGY